MSQQSDHSPVTLVVDRSPAGGGLLSWTFANQRSAAAVARALRANQHWVLVRGVFGRAADALAAARQSELVLEQSSEPPASGVRSCAVHVLPARSSCA